MSESQNKIDEIIEEYQQIEEGYQKNELISTQNEQKIANYQNIIEILTEKYKKLCIENKIDFHEEEESKETKIFSTKEISLKMNANNNSPEKNNDLNLNENIVKGFQRISMKLMNSCEKLRPINDLITDDIKNNEKIALIYEKAKGIIINLSIQVEASLFFYCILSILKE